MPCITGKRKIFFSMLLNKRRLGTMKRFWSCLEVRVAFLQIRSARLSTTKQGLFACYPPKEAIKKRILFNTSYAFGSVCQLQDYKRMSNDETACTPRSVTPFAASNVCAASNYWMNTIIRCKWAQSVTTWRCESISGSSMPKNFCQEDLPCKDLFRMLFIPITPNMASY